MIVVHGMVVEGVVWELGFGLIKVPGEGTKIYSIKIRFD